MHLAQFFLTLGLILTGMSELPVIQPIQSEEINIPAPTAQAVSDVADLLTDAEEKRLSQRLTAYRDSTTHQIAVVTVPVSWLGGETAESYANKLARAWKLGEAEKDNGVLFLIVGAKTDTKGRKIRFEVGYGLEGALPDAVCKRIQTELVVPEFKTGNYAAGIEKGADALMQAASGEVMPDAAPDTSRQEPENSAFFFEVFWLIAGAAQLLYGLGSETDGEDVNVVIGLLMTSAAAGAMALSWTVFGAVFLVLGAFAYLAWRGGRRSARSYRIETEREKKQKADRDKFFGIVKKPTTDSAAATDLTGAAIIGSSTYGSSDNSSSYIGSSSSSSDYSGSSSSSDSSSSSSNYSSSSSSSDYSSSSSSDYSGGGGDFGGGGASSDW